MGQMDGALIEFFAESEEILQRVASNLNKLEQGQHSQEMLDELYRDMHTTKGSAQLFGFESIGRVAHAMETCLDPIRRTLMPPNAVMLDALYACVSLVETLLNTIKSGGDPVANEQINMVLATLFDSAVRQFGADFELVRDVLFPPENLTDFQPAQQAPDPVLAPVATVVATPTSAKEERVSDEKNLNIEKRESENDADSTIRVQVGLLDMLMNLVGEMVLVRNQVLQHSSRTEDLSFLNLSQRLDVVTTELQDQVMKTRMQPIGNILGKFQRLIRDLARDLGKKIDLTLQGKDTELDKTLLEAIKDPLTHIVRNACDHGIETTETRVKAGKPETGHVLIRAFHEGGQVIVEISDDGAGLNRKRIVKKAIERGILSTDMADKMSDRECMNLIFHPGLSTAEQVSSVSGRGVGMDVVKTNIERIGGSVELDSVEGKGSTVRLRIPLTLAIVPAMLVRSGSDEYAIPQIKLVELVRVEQEAAGGGAKIQFVQGRPVYQLRGKLLPLVDLRSVLNGKREAIAPEKLNNETINIVVLNAEGDCFGLIVDEVLDTADIVVKPLSKFLKSLEVFSAATILGSGRVALILDPLGIAKSAELILEKKASESNFQSAAAVSNIKNHDSQEYLLFSLQEGKFAIPLALVSRLEEFEIKHIEYSGEQRVIQYRDMILPLISVAQSLTMKDDIDGSLVASTIVIQRGKRAFGLVVKEILDVCADNTTIDDSVKDRFGIMGNMIYNDEVVVVIDAMKIIEKEIVRISGQKAEDLNVGGAKFGDKKRILYAEDVGFFRRQVSSFLKEQGFEVLAVEDGAAAYNALQENTKQPFDLILSDIEMPNLNGIQFARKVRADKRFDNIPLIALTTKFAKRDVEEGRQAGFNSYLEKLNSTVLMENIYQLLGKKEAA